MIPLAQSDDLTIIEIDCTELVRDAVPNITGPLGPAGVRAARSRYLSDADFRIALTDGIDRKGIHEWSRVIYRLKQSAPSIADKAHRVGGGRGAYDEA